MNMVAAGVSSSDSQEADIFLVECIEQLKEINLFKRIEATQSSQSGANLGVCRAEQNLSCYA